MQVIISIVGSILNLPYTIVGIVVGIFSLPTQIKLNWKPFAIIITIKSFWWGLHFKNARAMAIGQIVLLGPKLENKDLEHELIHIEQFRRAPLIHPILNAIELYRHGYKNNKYEVEAYSKAGNIYRG